MLQLDGRWWKVYKRTRARLRYTRTIAGADHVITGATKAAEELVATFGIPRTRVSVVPHAADDFRAADPALVDTLLAQLGVAGPFLLAVGSQEPRKNLGVLYEAMRLLEQRGCKIPLVLCGPRGIHGFRHGDATPPWLRHAGFVRDDELAALYARASALVFPSRYEGFGLPVLEAMTVGGAVICADASTMPEVGGDAVLYFPPDDASALAAQVVRLLDDPALRATLVTAGARQASRYSWSRSALGTLAALDAGIAAHQRR
jgi:glycosyltransferase involved in cell wall biosynthesis